MGEFFKGWRRKAGFVTLVLAFVAMSGWVRGLLFLDFMTVSGWIVPYENSEWLIVSSEVGIEWEREWSDLTTFDRKVKLEWHSIAHRLNKRTPRNLQYDVSSHWDFCGFQTDKSGQNGFFACSWVIPYWPIVLSLTLLSAYLLFVKPRVATPQKTIEPNRA